MFANKAVERTCQLLSCFALIDVLLFHCDILFTRTWLFGHLYLLM